MLDAHCLGQQASSKKFINSFGLYICRLVRCLLHLLYLLFEALILS